MGQKANYTTLVLFYLTTCPFKQEGTQIRTEEMLITKVEKKKTLESFYTAQIQIIIRNKTFMYYVAYQFILRYPVFVDAMVLQEHLVYLQNTGNRIWLKLRKSCETAVDQIYN